MKHFFIALQFLTILPVKLKSEIQEKDYGTSLFYFPLIGVFIGILLSITAFLFSFLPNLVMAVFILIVSIIITGGIHLDGFADTCDGFYGSKPKEKILEIMRDSRVGVMGVIGIICILLLKFTLIVSIPQNILWKPLIMMTVFARWSQVLACYTSNYARREGKARYFIEYAGKKLRPPTSLADSGLFLTKFQWLGKFYTFLYHKKEFFAGSFFTIVLFLLLAKLKGMILFGISIVPIFLFINYVKKRIGGMTGDTIGATSEIAEVIVLFFAQIGGL